MIAAAAPMLACSATLRHGVNTTEAATGLQEVTYSQRNELDPAVSPDGKALAYEAADTLDAPPHVEIMPLPGVGAGKAARIEYTSDSALGLEPAWTPDGSSLVFVSNAHGEQGLVQTFGEGPARVNFVETAADPGLYAYWPSLSPRGGAVALTLGPVELFHSGWRNAISLSSAVGISDLSGTGVNVLGPGFEPAWSPDGKRLAFARIVDGHAHLFVAAADGAGAQQITYGSEDDEQPAWSPDGKAIAYCSERRNGDLWTQANLFVVRPDGSGLEQLTEGDRMACRPAWAPDGFLYFHANEDDRFHIWRLRPLVSSS